MFVQGTVVRFRSGLHANEFFEVVGKDNVAKSYLLRRLSDNAEVKGTYPHKDLRKCEPKEQPRPPCYDDLADGQPLKKAKKAELVVPKERARVISMPSDNSCLLHALYYGVHSTLTDSPGRLRKQLMEYLREHQTDKVAGDETWEQWIRTQTLPDPQAAAPQQLVASRRNPLSDRGEGLRVQEYIDLMSHEKQWAGSIEMALFCAFKKSEVWVFRQMENGNFERILVCGSSYGHLRLIAVIARFNRSGQVVHYNALQLNNA